MNAPLRSMSLPAARPLKHRTRHLLPLEMCLASLVIILGLSGGISHGALYRALEVRGETWTWLFLLSSAGSVWFSSAMTEWFFGQRWEEPRLRVAIWIRMWGAFLAAGAWVICLYVLIESHGVMGRSLVFYAMMSPVMAIFCGWCWWVNYRTETMLDPTLDTVALERRLDAQRPVRW